MPKLFLTVEDSKANVVGFQIEETIVDAQGKSRGDRVELIPLGPGSSFPRNGIKNVDPAMLGIDVAKLPSYVGADKGNLKTPDKIREEIDLFGEVQAPEIKAEK